MILLKSLENKKQTACCTAVPKEPKLCLVIFRLCVASKLNYMLRSLPPSELYSPAVIARATALMKNTWKAFLD